MSGKILITGASGFVGQHLAADFVRTGIKPRATTRSPHTTTGSVEWFQIAGFHDRPALRAALGGVDTVFHLAGRVHIPNLKGFSELDEFRRVNCDATTVLLEECAAAGVGRIIFSSTVKVMGPFTGTPFTEAMTPHPEDAYGQSKLEAEGIVRTLATKYSIGFVILRFPVIFGPGMKANMLRLFEAVENGIPLPFRGVRNARSILYVRNAVAGLRHVAESDAARGETFFISDGPALSTEELVRLIAAGMNRSPRLFKLPSALMRGVAAVGDVISSVVPAPVSSAVVERVFGSLAVNDSKIRDRTGFQPPFVSRDGVKQTAEWFVNRRSSQ